MKIGSQKFKFKYKCLYAPIPLRKKINKLKYLNLNGVKPYVVKCAVGNKPDYRTFLNNVNNLHAPNSFNSYTGVKDIKNYEKNTDALLY